MDRLFKVTYLVEPLVPEPVLANHLVTVGKQMSGQGAGPVAVCSLDGQVIVQSIVLVSCPQAH